MKIDEIKEVINIKTYHVGGFNPLNRCKTLADALAKAKDDDIIEIHKTIKESVTTTKAVIIKGNNNKFLSEQGVVGISTNNHLVIYDMNFVSETRSNAIVSEGRLELNNCKFKIKGPVREFYPLLWIKLGSCTVRACELMSVQTEPEVQFTGFDTKFSSYYGGDIELSTRVEKSFIQGPSQLRGCDLSSTVLDQFNLEDCRLNKFVTLGDGIMTSCLLQPEHSEPSVKLEKEHSLGPLGNQTGSLVCAYVDGDVVIDNLLYAGSSDFIGIFGVNCNITLKNTNCPKGILRHKLTSSAFSAMDVVDDNFWEFDSTNASFVRSKVNSNSKQKTAVEKLNELIGLHRVKTEIEKILINNQQRKVNQNKDFDFSYHMIFAGDPGTGKTTVARIVAEALFEIGAIPENKLTQATVDSLIKGYVGQTAQNVKEIIDKARGGVLFIDEAYQLSVKDGQNTFNDDALSVLIREMEDNRSDLIVIMAGYTKEMKELQASNIGIERRTAWIEFDDYTPEEMAQIFELMRKSNEIAYEDPALERVMPIIFKKVTELHLSKPDTNGRYTNGGNGGLVRNVLQSIITARNYRMAKEGGTDCITKLDIQNGVNQYTASVRERK